MELRYGIPSPSPCPPYHRRSTAPTLSSSTFSSSLLDAIYRSMGDNDSNSVVVEPRATKNGKHDTARTPRPAATLSRRYLHEPSSSRVKEKTKFRDDLRERYKFTAAVTRFAHLTASSSSSSDRSSCTGFSSEDSNILPNRLKLKPPRTGSIPSNDENIKKQRPPASPGALLASFISSVFSATKGRWRQKKHHRASADAAGAATESCSSSPSFVRSCMNRSAAAEEKKRVRFKAAATVEELPRRGFHGGRIAAVQEARKMRSPSLSSSGRGIEEEEEESDASSDLFELESLTVGRYTDELPVYGSTHLANSDI